MLENEYENRTEGATVRRIGKFGPPDVSSVMGQHPASGTAAQKTDEDQPTTRKALRLSRAGFSLLLMLVGVVALTAGIWFTFGIGWGLSTLGGMLFAIGILMALPDGSDSDSE